MKSVRRNVIFSAVGYALPMLAALATIPIMVNKLGTDLYGLYVICTSLIGFLTLIDLGIGQSVIRYVASFEAAGEKLKVKPVLEVALLVYLAIGLISAAVLYLFSPVIASGLYSEEAKQLLAVDVLRLTAIPLLFSYINQFFFNICKAYHRFDIPAVIHNAGHLGGVGVGAALLLLGYSLLEVIWGYVVIQGLTLSAGILFGLKMLPKGVWLKPKFHREIFDEIVSFSFYTFIGNFIGTIVSRADKLLIGVVIGTDAVTYYQIPFTIAQMSNGIIHTLVHISFPRFSELVSLGKRDYMKTLYESLSNVMLVINIAIAVMLITVGSDFLSLWISAEFAQHAGVTLQIIALYFFLHSNTVTGYWFLQSGGQAKLTALISLIGAVAYFMGVYILGEKYGHNGVAAALFLLLLAMPLQYAWIIQYLSQRWEMVLIQVLTGGWIGYGLIYMLESLNQWLNNSAVEIFVNGLVVFCLLVASVWGLLGKHRKGMLEKRYAASPA